MGRDPNCIGFGRISMGAYSQVKLNGFPGNRIQWSNPPPQVHL